MIGLFEFGSYILVGQTVERGNCETILHTTNNCCMVKSQCNAMQWRKREMVGELAI